LSPFHGTQISRIIADPGKGIKTGGPVANW
jgi:hypothetical protein